MVSEMSLPTTIMICVGWRKKNGEIVSRVHTGWADQ